MKPFDLLVYHIFFFSWTAFLQSLNSFKNAIYAKKTWRISHQLIWFFIWKTNDRARCNENRLHLRVVKIDLYQIRNCDSRKKVK